jgi:hypothetical protein
LVDFDINKKMTYIMFLKKESENTYVTMSNQTDPEDSIQSVGAAEYSNDYIQHLLK